MNTPGSPGDGFHCYCQRNELETLTTWTHSSDNAFGAERARGSFERRSRIARHGDLQRQFLVQPLVDLLLGAGVAAIAECNDVEVMTWLESRVLLAYMGQEVVPHSAFGGRSSG